MHLRDLATPQFRQDPYPTYARLRDAGPLVEVEARRLMSGRYSVVESLLSDRRVGRDYLESIRLRYGDDAPQMPLFQGMSRMFLLVNAPAHTRLRGLMTQAFSARQIESMRQVASDTAAGLIATFRANGHCDLLQDFAFPLPVSIICRMLDIDPADATTVGHATSALAKVFDAMMTAEELEATSAAYLQLERYFQQVIEQRRSANGDDLISRFIRAEDDGRRLSSDEIVSNVILLFFAGHETTSNMICNALVALHRHPDQLAMLKQNPALMPNAVLECLRYDSSVQMATRTVLQEFDIDGVTLREGDMVYLMLGAANHDTQQFTNPHLLDIRRQQGRALSFGGGIHHCLGNRLALIEMEAALAAVLEQLPALRLEQLDALTWNDRSNLRGVDALLASW
ncbi:cytochrome P450 [Xanthomonas campestris pv. badrii]|uniref:Cytochrome P450 n=1 Tax=Xanthomonas campestris pv. badrii TaxID=149696 RepID=A0A7Z2VBJ7_XANCA|nr:cytochrome P450 [Xanthomonas campestris]MCC4602646.1 cytochrome P450 [Xanthomonas campestris pv. parthenii]QJD68582.1 cytochrome P450 [Xanthomonas campestris pv. badrii]